MPSARVVKLSKIIELPANIFSFQHLEHGAQQNVIVVEKLLNIIERGHPSF